MAPEINNFYNLKLNGLENLLFYTIILHISFKGQVWSGQSYAKTDPHILCACRGEPLNANTQKRNHMRDLRGWADSYFTLRKFRIVNPIQLSKYSTQKTGP